MARQRVLRRYEGRTYLNLSISAQRDAEVAAVEPFTLLLNAQPFPLAKWEKPGLLAGLKSGRNRKKIVTHLATYCQQVDSITQKAADWYFRTQDLRWSQADVLQIMEEIERVGTESFKLFFAARHNLELGYNRLLRLLPAQQALPAKLALIQAALGDQPDVVEYQMAAALFPVGELTAADPATVAWLQARNFGNWQQHLPNKPIVDAVTSFMKQYGHRCVNVGEVSQPRWHEDPAHFFATLHTWVEQPPKPPKPPAEQDLQPLLAALAAGERAGVQALIPQLRQLVKLQSQALHAFAYLLGGTRRWALAAAKEAMADGRLQQSDDLFFFELEEIKQMMTGEWNISALATIHATCRARRAEYAQWQQLAPPPLLIGDSAAHPVDLGFPGSSGLAIAPLHRCVQPMPPRTDGVIVGAPHLDSGWSLLVPFARALVAAEGTPLDPIVAAARSWQVPLVLGLGDRYTALREDVPTTVNADSGLVEQ